MMQRLVFKFTDCPFNNKVRLAAALCNEVIEYLPMSYLKEDLVNYRKGPAIITSVGLICGSNNVMKFLARMHPESKLYGSTVEESTLIDSIIEAIYVSVELALLDYLHNNTKVEFMKILNSELEVWNKEYSKKPFYFGNFCSLVDISIINIVCLVSRKLKLINMSNYANLEKLVQKIESDVEFVLYENDPEEFITQSEPKNMSEEVDEKEIEEQSACKIPSGQYLRQKKPRSFKKNTHTIGELRNGKIINTDDKQVDKEDIKKKKQK